MGNLLTMNNLVLNLTRIGKKGAGLASFSRQVTACLSLDFKDLIVITSRNFELDNETPFINTPKWISNTPSVSILRPILWIIYAYLFFPKRNGFIISTTHHAIPRAKRQIITIHDLRPYYFPDSLLQQVYFRYILPVMAKKIDGIFTVSKSTKLSIIKLYNIQPESIHIISNYIDTNRFKASKSTMENRSPYLLIVGATWKHKNAHEVLTMSSVWEEKYSLKIISSPGKYKEYLIRLVKENGLQNKVEFINYPSAEKIITLYQQSAALIYPSILEGFGIPPLEAAACGKPVIVSNIPIFHEIYGDFPIFVDLGSKRSWVKGINLLSDKIHIDAKISLGKLKVAEFSKQRMRKELEIGIRDCWANVQK